MDRNKQQKSYKLLKLAMIFFLFSMALTSCSCGNSAANRPEVKITTSPTGITAGDVTISVEVSNFNLVQEEGNQNTYVRGHIIYYMDCPVPTYYEHSAISKAGTYAITSDTSYTWKGVSPGEHTFAVQLVKENDTPLAAPVTNSITINVGPPQGHPVIKFITPREGSSLSPGNIAVAVSVENFIISPEDMGVVNRMGEGHLIYYLDEEPPTDSGVPAVTDTSKVSADTTYLWKNVKEGKHTLAVQVVNNDDTPLDSPLAKNITIDVML